MTTCMTVNKRSFKALLLLLSQLLIGPCEANGQMNQLCPADDLSAEVDMFIMNAQDCKSCDGQCGSVQASVTDAQDTCSCDIICVTYRDCCPDFAYYCPDLHSQARDYSNRYGYPLEGFRTTCSDNNLVVNECPHDLDACTIGDDISDRIPVRDLNTGVDFVNARCALCNSVTDGVLWVAVLECENGVPELNLNGTVAAANITTEEINDVLSNFQNLCFFVLKAPVDSRRVARECRATYMEESCSEPCENTDLARACATGNTQVVHVRYSYVHYKNIYCALCAIVHPDIERFKCGYLSIVTGEDYYPTDHSFTLLFSFDPSSKHGVSKTCPKGKEYINKYIGCKAIVPTDTTVSNNASEEAQAARIFLNLHDHISLSFEFLSSEVYVRGGRFGLLGVYTPALFVEDFCRYVAKTWRRNVTRDLAFFNCTFIANNTENKSFSEEIQVQMLTEWNTLNTSTVEMSTGALLKEIIATVNATDAFNTIPLVIFTRAVVSTQERITISCVSVSFLENEYSLEESHLMATILSSSQVIPRGHYIIYDSVLFVCKDTLRRDKSNATRNSLENSILSILTIICLSLSALCLLLRLVLQCIVPSYNSFPMKLQFNFCFILFLSSCLFLFSPLVTNYGRLCVVVAIAMHYSFLSSFLWLSVIAADMYMSLRSFENMQKAASKSSCKHMLTHHAAAWGIPAVFVAVAIIFDYGDFIGSQFRPMYGGDRCWISANGYAIPIFFGLPVLLTIVINTTLFILLSSKLSKAFKERKKLSQQTKSSFWIYVKLFVLLGVGNILMVLLPFVDHFALRLCVILIKTTDGIYIGIIYVFKRNVLLYLRCKAETKGTSVTVTNTKSGDTQNAITYHDTVQSKLDMSDANDTNYNLINDKTLCSSVNDSVMFHANADPETKHKNKAAQEDILCLETNFGADETQVNKVNQSSYESIYRVAGDCSNADGIPQTLGDDTGPVVVRRRSEVVTEPVSNRTTGLTTPDEDGEFFLHL